MTAVQNQMYRNPQSGSYVIQLTDYYIAYTGTGVSHTFLLPSASLYSGTTQQTYLCKNVGVGTVTLITQGSDTIESSNSSLIVSPGNSVRVVSDGISNWELI